MVSLTTLFQSLSPHSSSLSRDTLTVSLTTLWQSYLLQYADLAQSEMGVLCELVGTQNVWVPINTPINQSLATLFQSLSPHSYSLSRHTLTVSHTSFVMLYNYDGWEQNNDIVSWLPSFFILLSKSRILGSREGKTGMVWKESVMRWRDGMMMYPTLHPNLWSRFGRVLTWLGSTRGYSVEVQWFTSVTW